jgi:outer membrane murein-binding lipoprotein Lpp
MRFVSRWIWLFATISLSTCLAGCEKQQAATEESGPVETAGKKIDQAAAKTGEELSKLAEKAGAELKKAGEAIQNKASEVDKKESQQ